MAHAKFEFDEWAKLAKDDPEEFSARRQVSVGQLIDQAPTEKAKRRLERLQFHIDMEIRKSRHPMGACVRLHSMMLDYAQGIIPTGEDIKSIVFDVNDNSNMDGISDNGKVIYLKWD
jgi:hypothetical protein